MPTNSTGSCLMLHTKPAAPAEYPSWKLGQTPTSTHTAVVLAVSLLAAVQSTASKNAYRNNMLNKNANSIQRTTAAFYFEQLL
jgi:hypothetical protein